MKQPLRVLLVEDSEDDALLLSRELRRGDYQLRIERVETEEQMRAALLREEWDAVFADYSLPHFSGPEAVAIAKELAPDIPILVISGTVGETAAVDIMRAGAHDFILREQLARLHPALARELRDAEVRKMHRKAESDYLMLFNEMLDGFAVHEIVTDEQDHPIDYRFLAVNPAFERMTGLRADDVIGRTALEVLPGLEPTWVERYGRVALTGEPTRFEQYSAPLDKHFQVSVFSPRPRQFATVFVDITERKHMDEQLRRSEERFLSAFEFAPIGMAITAPDGHWLKVNRALCELVGYAEEELLRTTFQAITHPDDLNPNLDLLRRSLAGEIKSYQMEKRFLQKSGEIVWALLSVSLVRDAQGEPLTFVSQILDINARKQAEEAMRLQSTALNAAANAIAITGSDGVITWVNPAWTTLTGYTAEETIGRNPNLLQSSLMDEAFYKKLWTTILSGEVWHGELVNRRKDGTLYTEEQTITPLEDAAHRITHFIAIKQDISERKQAEANLRKTEQNLSSIYNTVGDVIFHLNVEPGECYRFVSVNPAFLQVTGLSQDMVVGKTVDEVIPASSLPLVLEKYRQAIAEKTIMRWEETSDYPSGQRVGEVTVAPVYDDEGNCTHLVGSVHDITVRKQATIRLQAETARTQTLLSISRRLNTTLDLDAILKTVSEEVARVLDAPAATINLFDEDLQIFQPSAAFGVPPSYSQRLRPMPLAQGHPITSLISQPVTVIADIQAIADAPNAELYAELGVRTVVVAPLIQNQQLIGNLEVLTFGETRQFEDDKLELIKGLTDQAAIAITNARRYAQADLRQKRLRALSEIDRAITASRGLAATLETVIEQVAAQLNVDAVAILLYHPEHQALEFAAGIGFRGDAVRRTPVPFRADRDANEHHIQFYDSQDPTLPAARTDVFAEEEFVSHFSIPLVAQERVLGVLEIFQRTRLEPNTEWLAFLESLALQAAIAVDHAALFTHTREQAHQLNQVLDTASDGIVMLDASRRVVIANPEGTRCLAILASAAVGDEITQLGGKPTTALLTMTAPSLGIQELVLPDGETAFEVTAKPVHDNGSVTGWVLLVRDVTVARRHRRLQAQQDRLAAVGQLAAGIAHDFNNILTPIRLSVDLSIEEAPTGSRLRTNLEQIAVAADRARDLVGHILAFSRSDTQTGRVPLNMQPIVDEALRLVRAGLPAQIEIRASLRDKGVQVLAVPGQIHQIVMNLCTNAFHAMQARGGVLTVGLEPFASAAELHTNSGILPPGDYVRLTVRDTGHGMERATVDRIFEPFFTTKAPGQGTGMGLSVVFGIVVESGGGIAVESVPGEGSEFSVYLPQIDVEREAASTAAAAEKGGMESILVVDDEAPITAVLRTVLERLGYSVATANDGPTALSMLNEDPTRFNLVITDLSMPQMSGLQLVATIKAMGIDLPVILMSGYSETSELEAYAEAGIRDFLTKPFNSQTVNTAIRRVLSVQG